MDLKINNTGDNNHAVRLDGAEPCRLNDDTGCNPALRRSPQNPSRGETAVNDGARRIRKKKQTSKKSQRGCRPSQLAATKSFCLPFPAKVFRTSRNNNDNDDK